MSERDLIESFRVESRERAARVREHLGDGAEEQAAVELRREVHTLKGTSSVLGLEELAALAGAMEDALVAAGTPLPGATSDALSGALDAFLEGIEAAADGSPLPDSVGEQARRLGAAGAR